jgi:hypothetical protein
VIEPHTKDVFLCPEPGCVWAITFPCAGGCEDGALPATVPPAVIAAIGAHHLWHARRDVRAGLVQLVYSSLLNQFVELHSQ